MSYVMFYSRNYQITVAASEVFKRLVELTVSLVIRISFPKSFWTDLSSATLPRAAAKKPCKILILSLLPGCYLSKTQLSVRMKSQSFYAPLNTLREHAARSTSASWFSTIWTEVGNSCSELQRKYFSRQETERKITEDVFFTKNILTVFPVQ